MGSICPCLSPGEDLDDEQKREIAIGQDIDRRKYISENYSSDVRIS